VLPRLPSYILAERSGEEKANEKKKGKRKWEMEWKLNGRGLTQQLEGNGRGQAGHAPSMPKFALCIFCQYSAL